MSSGNHVVAQEPFAAPAQPAAQAAASNAGPVANLPVESPFGLGAIMQGNPYFSAGFGLMLFGGVLAYARSALTWVMSAAQRHMLVSLEIPSKDRAHPWFLHWMGAQAAAQAMRRKANHGKLPRESFLEFLGLRQPKSQPIALNDPLRLPDSAVLPPVRIVSRELAVDTQYEERALLPGAQSGDNERGTATFSLVPGPGIHWFRYRGVWIRLQRERNGKMVDLTTGAPWETVTLTTLASYTHLFSQLLAEARELALSSTHGKTVVYTTMGFEWRPFGHPRRVRDLDSVVLAEGKKELIVNDIQRFLSRSTWYARRGIPYRRGYLLHGAPGSGKTSFITALAGSLDFNICLLNLAERGMTDDKLSLLMSTAPDRSIMVLEDVDAAFRGRSADAPERHTDGYQPNVTFSGLLNALDGVASGESRIIFMTTNHLERLDPALIRPGRVDLICELGDAEAAQVRELLIRFYYADLLLERVNKARRARDIEPIEFDDAAGTPPDAQTDYYINAAKETTKELEDLAEKLVQGVADVTARRRRALDLNEDGHQDESSTGMPPHWPQAAARGGVSMAELQGLFIRFADDPHAAVEAFVHENS
ncbi:Complex III assembly protein translocase and chaperone [Malassezia cuniculi]|uniref:Complex III assembly protein translocase and chaperone n=1 Tax=Malassezia cuniculi TaxID=948313 RepID=A0AAF0EVA4_9BASI|nr:Complex III assembly protein translocase and chaperone [Malassezia cuniculi]